ncbi:hypothetical protein [Halarcobacter sp.]|uniref:hypothetical protein n=1 Tax=Halarcobacter sp. TaxID=2321133 RepID=UPI0029F470EF|nr:hypothetical protein [Halarcobacter sp.]
MRRSGASDSQVVNNFFTFASIVLISITITLYSNYFSQDEDIIKIEKIPCELDTFTKVSLLDLNLLKKSQKALDKGYYKVEGSYLKLENNSTIEDVVKLPLLDSFYESLIGVKPKENIEKYLKIRYELIEKDKKNQNIDRLGAGTLISSFRINSKELLRFESDFKFLYENAIKDRIECSIKVYKNYVNY